MSKESIKTIQLLPNGQVWEINSDGKKLLIGQTHWEQIDSMSEEEIEALALSDPDNLPLSETELQTFSPIPNPIPNS